MDIFKKTSAFNKKTISEDPYVNDSVKNDEIEELKSELTKLHNDYNKLKAKHMELVKKWNPLVRESNSMYEQFQVLEKENQMLKMELDKLKSNGSFAKKERQITDKQIQEIKQLRELGLSYSKIAERTKWSKCTISRVINGYYD